METIIMRKTLISLLFGATVLFVAAFGVYYSDRAAVYANDTWVQVIRDFWAMNPAQKDELYATLQNSTWFVLLTLAMMLLCGIVAYKQMLTSVGTVNWRTIPRAVAAVIIGAYALLFALDGGWQLALEPVNTLRDIVQLSLMDVLAFGGWLTTRFSAVMAVVCLILGFNDTAWEWTATRPAWLCSKAKQAWVWVSTHDPKPQPAPQAENTEAGPSP